MGKQATPRTELYRVTAATWFARNELFPRYSREQLLTRPKWASALCVAVRRATDLDWPDHLILSTLFPPKRMPWRTKKQPLAG